MTFLASHFSLVYGIVSPARDPILSGGDKLRAGMRSNDLDVRSPPTSRAIGNRLRAPPSFHVSLAWRLVVDRRWLQWFRSCRQPKHKRGQRNNFKRPQAPWAMPNVPHSDVSSPCHSRSTLWAARSHPSPPQPFRAKPSRCPAKKRTPDCPNSGFRALVLLGHSASRFAMPGSRSVSWQIAPHVPLGLTTYNHHKLSSDSQTHTSVASSALNFFDRMGSTAW